VVAITFMGSPHRASGLRQWQDVAVARTNAVVSRRRALTGGAALATLGLLASGCGSPPPPPPRVDDLKAQSELASRDSELAAGAAAAASEPMTAALKEVAAERARHARALDIEVARVAAGSTTTSPAASETTGATTSAVTKPPPSVTDVVNALRDSAESARQVALTSSDYRAGLLASITASCTAAVMVALAPGEPAR
jgi:hypothetical protein